MRVGCPEEDQLVVSISDIEMGCGGMFDDFPHTRFLADLIRSYAGAEREHLDVHLVFNGDTFDFLKMPVDGVYPTLVTESVALQKLQLVIDSHPEFFDGLRDFLEAKAGRGHVYFVVGNHDLELFFEGVQQGIAARIGCEGVHFPGLSVAFGDLVVEHGSQGDSLFRVDPERPFIETSEGPALALPWGAIALLEVAMPMQEQMYALDRLKPRERVFELLPEVREQIVAAFRQYWLDSARTWLGPDPLHRLSWAMVKEVAYRFRTQRADLDATGGLMLARVNVLRSSRARTWLGYVCGLITVIAVSCKKDVPIEMPVSFNCSVYLAACVAEGGIGFCDEFTGAHDCTIPIGETPNPYPQRNEPVLCTPY